MDYRIFPPDEIIETEISLPLSKSETNRALIMNALTPGDTPVGAIAECDDTRALIEALGSDADTINIGDCGTAMRFLTGYFAAKSGRTVTLDGSERMRQRPIGPLVDALHLCGANIEYVGVEGYPPLLIHGTELKGGTIEIDATVSSQFISSLLMIAPTMTEGLTLNLKGEPSSLPYILMTLGMMEQRGITCERIPDQIIVNRDEYRPTTTPIEPDWSAASYWFELSSMGSAYIGLPGLKLPSLQGDAACAKIFQRLGVMTEEEDGVLQVSPSPDMYGRVDLDMSDTPDMAPSIIVACAALGVPFHITGLGSLAIKECDRLQALHNELLKLGVEIEIERGNSAIWEGRRLPVFEVPVIETYGDHRIAMSFAPLATLIPGIIIKDIEVVSKSYPHYWDDLRKAGFIMTDAAEPIEDEESEES
ncbi:MAG: 3-phosphoshikimate 1-carboxyvinyltransferase [Muribaculaceae bacterium]|nr:3-phosphoshikimate 1-carboxyvinyltransferase [Muribaculaceae bacterium]MDE6321872.1 3-phosphoshikimate 1-carboxyvinyltransferase [Muribaculaceae bacterium]